MAEKGWISKWALQDSCLAADTIGRSAVEDGYFAASIAMRSKFANSFVDEDLVENGAITVSKLSTSLLSYLLSVGRIDYSNMDYCKIG